MVNARLANSRDWKSGTRKGSKTEATWISKPLRCSIASSPKSVSCANAPCRILADTPPTDAEMDDDVSGGAQDPSGDKKTLYTVDIDDWICIFMNVGQQRTLIHCAMSNISRVSMHSF